ncbi:MAG: PAS domain S-box protein [Halobacteriota archaeon]|nr:PAS domain S-box protein [Halobacteriota archaeon]
MQSTVVETEKIEKPIRILLIEDNPGDARLIREMLIEAGTVKFDVIQIESLREAFKILDEEYFDVVLSDLGLPDSWGLDTFVRLHTHAPEMPIIVLTGLNDESIGTEAVREGAQDYLVKGHVDGDLLSRTTKYAIERKRVEEDLLMEKKFSDSVINSLPGVFYLFDNKGQLLRWNKNAEKISGYSHEEIKNMNILDFFSGEEKKIMAEELQEVVAKGEATAEAKLTAKSGNEIPHFFTGLRTIISERLYLVGMGMDITEIKRMEEALRESEEKYRNLVERANDGIVIIQDGSFKFANSMMAKMLGYEIEDLEEEKLLNFVSPDFKDRVKENYESRQKGKNAPTHLELEFIRKDGKILYTDVNMAMIEREGRPADLVFIRDVSERKRAEKERERLNEEIYEKNKELEQIVYVASHDLRSPLLNVQGFSKELKYSMEELSSLLNDDQVPPEVQNKLKPIFEEDIPETLEFIQTSILKMDTLLGGLLRLSRLGRAALEFEDLDMNSMLSEIEKSFEFRVKEAGMNLSIGELPPCVGDAVQINQVFSNLVDNALKYRDPEKEGFIKITGVREGDQVVYCVEDNGIGIPERHLKDVFIIFHRVGQSTVEGEGLGLSLISKILSRNNGKIWVESEEGVGSKFFVSLPVTSDDDTT